MKIWCAAALALAVVACGPSRADDRDEARGAAAARPAEVPAAASPAPDRPRIVALGDSLTAGLGLPASAAYPALLAQRLKDAGMDFEVVNAGVSGDTSAGGLERLDWALQGDVRVLILALGANDGLRGLTKKYNLPLIDYEKEILLRRPQDWNGTLLNKNDAHPSAGDGKVNSSAEPTEENLARSGYLLRGWLSVKKIGEVKRTVLGEK